VSNYRQQRIEATTRNSSFAHHFPFVHNCWGSSFAWSDRIWTQEEAMEETDLLVEWLWWLSEVSICFSWRFSFKWRDLNYNVSVASTESPT